MKIKFENKNVIEVDNIYAVADIHLFHKNLCSATSEWEDKERCRQFSSIEEMNKTILDGINNNVKENDCLILFRDALFVEYKNRVNENLFGDINKLFNTKAGIPLSEFNEDIYFFQKIDIKNLEVIGNYHENKNYEEFKL